MRAIVRAKQHEEAMERSEMKKHKKTKKRQVLRQKTKELEKSKKTMEWNTADKLYRNPKTNVTLYKQVVFKNLHPDLRRRFYAKCVSEGITVIGKLRYFMWASIKGKIKPKIGGLDISFADTDSLKDIPHIISIGGVPSKLHTEFKKYCNLRGWKISERLRDLIISYLKGEIE